MFMNSHEICHHLMMLLDLSLYLLVVCASFAIKKGCTLGPWFITGYMVVANSLGAMGVYVNQFEFISICMLWFI